MKKPQYKMTTFNQAGIYGSTESFKSLGDFLREYSAAIMILPEGCSIDVSRWVCERWVPMYTYE